MKYYEKVGNSGSKFYIKAQKNEILFYWKSRNTDFETSYSIGVYWLQDIPTKSKGGYEMAKAKIMKFEELPDQLSAQHIADYLGKSRRWVYEMMKISPEVGGIPSYTRCV